MDSAATTPITMDIVVTKTEATIEVDKIIRCQTTATGTPTPTIEETHKEEKDKIEKVEVEAIAF